MIDQLRPINCRENPELVYMTFVAKETEIKYSTMKTLGNNLRHYLRKHNTFNSMSIVYERS
jgi:hypothetical protein